MSDIKTYNGWFSIEDTKPNDKEEVVVILERESSMGCTYDYDIRTTYYIAGYPKGQFILENGAWHVKYWRKKEVYPLPDEVVRKEVAECKKHNVSFKHVVEHQRSCGIEVNID